MWRTAGQRVEIARTCFGVSAVLGVRTARQPLHSPVQHYFLGGRLVLIRSDSTEPAGRHFRFEGSSFARRLTPVARRSESGGRAYSSRARLTRCCHSLSAERKRDTGGLGAYALVVRCSREIAVARRFAMRSHESGWWPRLTGFSVLAGRCDERSRQAASGLPGSRFALADRTSLIARAVSSGGLTGLRARSARLRGLVSSGCGLLLVVPRCRGAGSAGCGPSMGGCPSPSSQGLARFAPSRVRNRTSTQRQRARPAPRALCRVLCRVSGRRAGGFHGWTSCSPRRSAAACGQRVGSCGLCFRRSGVSWSRVTHRVCGTARRSLCERWAGPVSLLVKVSATRSCSVSS
jgi:hypothetical protein